MKFLQTFFISLAIGVMTFVMVVRPASAHWGHHHHTAFWQHVHRHAHHVHNEYHVWWRSRSQPPAPTSPPMDCEWDDDEWECDDD